LIERGSGAGIEAKAFGQCVSETLGRAAEDLPLDDHRIDRATDIVR
jgi:hypothetical protein